MSLEDPDHDPETDTDRADPEASTAEAVSTRDAETTPDRADLEAQLDLLAEENRRLRREYARVRTSQYRRTALGLFTLGAVGVVSGAVFPGSRTVLFVLGATGLFGGLLTYYLTPERFIPASVGERVYAAFASTSTGIVADLGLSDHRVYVPTDDGTRLFVPQRDAFDLPSPEALEATFVVESETSTRGLATDPTGDRLFAEFETARTAPLESALDPLADQLTDALVEQFELVDRVETEVEPGAGRTTFGISDDAYGAVDRFDHPVASFLGVGMARGVESATTVTVSDGDDRSAYLVTVEILEPSDA